MNAPNAALSQPFYVRGKWKIGFVALRDISEGHKVVSDYDNRQLYGEVRGNINAAWQWREIASGKTYTRALLLSNRRTPQQTTEQSFHHLNPA